MYQLAGGDVLMDWLSGESDPEEREAMLHWITAFCHDPLAEATRVPGVRAPVYVVITPVRRQVLRFLLAEQFHTVKLIEFAPLP